MTHFLHDFAFTCKAFISNVVLLASFLIASRVNNQFANYVSRHPDPTVCASDAFTCMWNSYSCVYIFSPFSLIQRILEKDSGRKGTCRYYCSSRLANSELVSVSYETLCRSALCSSPDSRHIGFTASTTGNSQSVSKATSSCMSHIREIYQSKGIPQRTFPVLINSWRASFKKLQNGDNEVLSLFDLT